jgi:hypothetical protein
MPTINEDRPPYVSFETVAEEDRAGTISAGHYAAKDVDYAFITPQGSKDRIPRKVDEWFEALKKQVTEGRFKAEWLAAYEAQYKAWKAGQETPLNGSPITNWPAVSPAQVRALQAARLLTIEDLAVANEEALRQLGMGGRALKQRAIDWLSAAQDTGKAAEELTALKANNADLKASNEQLQAQVKELAGHVKQLLADRAEEAAAA